MPWLVTLDNPEKFSSTFGVNYFPRAFHYKHEANELAKTLKERGGVNVKVVKEDRKVHSKKKLNQ